MLAGLGIRAVPAGLGTRAVLAGLGTRAGLAGLGIRAVRGPANLHNPQVQSGCWPSALEHLRPPIVVEQLPQAVSSHLADQPKRHASRVRAALNCSGRSQAVKRRRRTAPNMGEINHTITMKIIQ